jgi:hypothetical protein
MTHDIDVRAATLTTLAAPLRERSSGHRLASRMHESDEARSKRGTPR